MNGKPNENGTKFASRSTNLLSSYIAKVKRDVNQAQQNLVTFNRFSLKVKTCRIKLNK